jgi:hypothetical protein
MTAEERQRMMEFILAQQAQFWASMQKHEEAQAEWQANHEEWLKRSEARIDHESFRVDRVSFRADRLERILKLMIRAGDRARRQVREHDRRFAEVAEMIAAGEQARARTDRKLESLLDLVRKQRNGEA